MRQGGSFIAHFEHRPTQRYTALTDMSTLQAGTSGFSYKEWCGAFYPPGLPVKRMLAAYASLLPTVELNNTFYRFPTQAMIESWCRQVPESFCFSVKASRQISHLRRLKDCEDAISRIQGLLPAFGQHLAAVLVQLPPNMAADLERLQRFLGQWGSRFPLAMEFRHPSWFEAPVLQTLSEHNTALCLGDPGSEEHVAPFEATADFAFMRFRGEGYSDEQLSHWASAIGSLRVRSAVAYFKHEVTGPGFAQRLNQLYSSQEDAPA